MSDQTWNPFDSDLLEQSSEAAKASAAQSNFGKLTIASAFKHWQKENGLMVDLTPDEFKPHAKERGYFQEVQFTVDPSDFNPNATFIFQRKVSVVASEEIRDANGAKTKKYTKSDWTQIVEPSIIAVFGSIAEMAKLTNAKAPVYVEVESVPQRADSRYNTLRFTRHFKNLAECTAAWKAKYGGNGASASPFDPEHLETVRNLRKMYKDETRVRAAIAADPALNAYPVDDLLTAAN